MGRRLAETLPAARKLYDRAGELLGYDLAKLCFHGPAEQLDSTVFSQPALFVTSLAALESLRAASPEVVESCEAAAGLSLGEYTAMVFADVMTFDDGLMLVQKRGAAMQEAADATPSGMVSILGLELDKVKELCDKARDGEILEIANLLSPGNIVISGTVGACERAAEMAQSAGRDESHALGGGGRVSHADHAAGRAAIGSGAVGRADAQAANSRGLELRCESRTTIPRKSAAC